MTLEASIFSALAPLAANRVFPDVAPADTVRPYITYQQVGGAAVNFLEATPPGARNARIQVNCWADSRKDAAELARQVEDAMMTSLKAEVLGAMVALYEDDPPLRGTMQDFSIWY